MLPEDVVNEVKTLDELLEEIIETCRSAAPPYCEATCPLHLDVKGYVNLIAEGKYAESLALIREKLPFPGILGRICSHPCETECQRGKVDQPVAVRALKRFVADREESPHWDLTIADEKKEKVAVVGSGPSGLMAAYELRKRGYRVTIIEALSQLGGMLRWGIPKFLLPRDIIDKELGIIEALGVEVKLNTRIGESITLDDLSKNYEAVFLATGAQKSARLGLDGEDLQGIYHGVEFLRNGNMGEQVDVGNRVIAIGQVPDSSSLVKGSRLKVSDRSHLEVDPVTLRTNLENVFAGGDAVTGPRSVVEALAMGREAAISIDRFVRGENLSVDRDQEDFYKNPLEMEIPSGLQKLDRTPAPMLPVEERKGNFKELELGFPEDIAVKEAQRCLSCECLACKKSCEFLSHHDMNPREFAEKLMQDYSAKLTVPFSCNICKLCGKMCPEGLDTGKLCHEIRKKAVNDGLAPLPQHKSVHSHQKWGTSWIFKLDMADPQNKKETSRVFFPGCNLPSYSPDLVVKTYNYLRDKLPGTGIILNCCGSPTYLIGEMARFQQILDGIEKQMRSLGASEIITACSKCYYILKNNLPQWKVSPLYGLMVDIGLPEGVPEKFNRVFSIHDSCPARYEEELRQGVRAVMDGLGCDIEAMEFSGEKTRCCGGGGMIAAVDPALFAKAKARRTGETLNDIVTYCAGCRDNIASLEKGALHILDLVFNPNWKQDRMKPPGSGKQRWRNRWDLKRQLKKL